MATKAKTAKKPTFFGLPTESFLRPAQVLGKSQAPAKGDLRVFLVGLKAQASEHRAELLRLGLGEDQMKSPALLEKDSSYWETPKGPLLVIAPAHKKTPLTETGGSFGTPYTRLAHLVGSLGAYWQESQRSVYWLGEGVIEPHEAKAIGLGLEASAYHFKKTPSKDPMVLATHWFPNSCWSQVEEGLGLGRCLNAARHAVNLPPNILNPESYAEAIASHFRKEPGFSIEVWDQEKLKAEGFGLHLAVGQGSHYEPRLVKLSYRPSGSPKPKAAPVVIVGKGITFDSGGLDIKPSSGMRWMKKDMGGSAALWGLSLWLRDKKPTVNVDLYFSLAENAVGSRSFRPGDIYQAYDGTSVEIHNTDAEGRLVMADALSYGIASLGETKPRAVVDIATLTGAIKVALGADIAGLFSNRDQLAQELMEAGAKAGEAMWRMPLYRPYENLIKSDFADYSNASHSSFGGAISAALFLAHFVRDQAWAHLDIYAWTDQARGYLRETGGSGQGTLQLIEWLSAF